MQSQCGGENGACQNIQLFCGDFGDRRIRYSRLLEYMTVVGSLIILNCVGVCAVVNTDTVLTCMCARGASCLDNEL